jgi:hypothetical protein
MNSQEGDTVSLSDNLIPDTASLNLYVPFTGRQILAIAHADRQDQSGGK